MPRPRLAPQLIHNTSAPTRSGVDVRRMGSSRPLALLQTTTARDTLLGADARPYGKVRGKEAKALFASKYVPMDDGTEVLESKPGKTISQRGYGNRVCKYPVAVPKDPRIGFDNTLVDTTSGGFKISKAGIIHHPQNAVYTDFHKGVLAGYDPASQPMWADGTYNETVAHMTKEHSGLPEDITFLPPHNPRQDIFNIQSLAGAQVYGDALFRLDLTRQFAEQRNENIKDVLRKQGMSEPLVTTYAELVERHRRQADVNRQLGLPPPPFPAVNVAVERAPGPPPPAVPPGGANAQGRGFPVEQEVALLRPDLMEGRDPFAELVREAMARPLPAIEGGMARPAPHNELVAVPKPMPPARPAGGGGRGGGVIGRVAETGRSILDAFMRGGGGGGGGYNPFDEERPLLEDVMGPPLLRDAPARGGGVMVVAGKKGNKK